MCALLNKHSNIESPFRASYLVRVVSNTTTTTQTMKMGVYVVEFQINISKIFLLMCPQDPSSKALKHGITIPSFLPRPGGFLQAASILPVDDRIDLRL